MASSRKKQDEKNLKILRELVSLQHNKHCFDCNQRGPTYVNVTIGSFVCTKCSGILRGLTPPHRVKSISMAMFTLEEVELLKNRGNDYCRKTWLGLYEGSLPSETRDEQTVRDFMIDKYERKRYYLEPSQALRNGYTQQQATATAPIKLPESRSLTHIISEPKPLRLNGNAIERKKRTNESKNDEFVADFASADIFSAVNNNSAQPSFANFDNNPVFNNTMDDFSIFDLKFTNNGPVLNQVPLFPKCNINRWNPFLLPVNPNNMFLRRGRENWVSFDMEYDVLSKRSMPTSATLNTLNNQQHSNVPGPLAPSEDRYAALKDLDNALKAQPIIDWNSGSSSSLYSSPTPAGSLYSSPSPQGSMYGSPSQGQFVSVFSQQESNISNPFNNGLTWNSNGNSNNNGTHQYVNPFRTNEQPKINLFSQAFQSTGFPNTNGLPWTPNPFKLGATSNGHSSNPFL